MLCRGQNVALYTLNGQLLLDQLVCDTGDDYVVSCAFYDGTGNEWLERDIVFTGHKRGIVNVGLFSSMPSEGSIQLTPSRYGTRESTMENFS
jgi:hypothetical protein